MTKKRLNIATTVLMSAAGLALAASVSPASAAMNSKMEQKLDNMLKMHPGASKETIEANMKRVAKNHLVRCYGVNAASKNDCASGAHSCSGQSAMPRNPAAFVLLPAGDCQKIAGGKLKGPM